MFENLKNGQNNINNSEVDDIFAEDEKNENNNDYLSPRLTSTRPSLEDVAPDNPNYKKERSFKEGSDDFLGDFSEEGDTKSGPKKILKTIFLAILGFLVIGVVAYFIYSKILLPQTLKTSESNYLDNGFIDAINNNDSNNLSSGIVDDVSDINIFNTENIVGDVFAPTEEVESDALLLLKNLDSDLDGLSDYDEIYVYFTDPYNADSDFDGLSDYDEIIIFGTDPLDMDSDGDGYSDGQEVLSGYNPLGSGKIDSAIFLDQDLFSEKYPNL